MHLQPLTLTTLTATLLLLLLTPTASARCTISYNTSFTLTTFHSATANFNDLKPFLSPTSLVTISPPTPGSPPDAVPATLLPFFRGGGIFRYADDGPPDTLEQGYLHKNPGDESTGYVFRFARMPLPPGVVAGKFEIGCGEKGRHILSLNGFGWQACQLGYSGEYRISRGVDDGRCGAADVWFWVDYIRPL